MKNTLIRLLLCVGIQMGELGHCLIMCYVIIVGIYRFQASMLKMRVRYILELIWTLLWMPRVSVWYARCVTWGLWMVDLGLTKVSANVHAIHITDRVLLIIIYVALTCFSLYVVLKLKIWTCRVKVGNIAHMVSIAHCVKWVISRTLTAILPDFEFQWLVPVKWILRHTSYHIQEIIPQKHIVYC